MYHRHRGCKQNAICIALIRMDLSALGAGLSASRQVATRPGTDAQFPEWAGKAATGIGSCCTL